MGLAGAAVADGDDILTALDVLAAGQFHDQRLVHRGDDREVEGVETLHCRESGGTDPAFHHPLMAVDEFQFGQTQQVLRVVRILGGVLGRHLAVLPEEAGQPEFLQVMFQKQSGLAAHAALLKSRLM